MEKPRSDLEALLHDRRCLELGKMLTELAHDYNTSIDTILRVSISHILVADLRSRLSKARAKEKKDR